MSMNSIYGLKALKYKDSVTLCGFFKVANLSYIVTAIDDVEYSGLVSDFVKIADDNNAPCYIIGQFNTPKRSFITAIVNWGIAVRDYLQLNHELQTVTDANKIDLLKSKCNTAIIKEKQALAELQKVDKPLPEINLVDDWLQITGNQSNLKRTAMVGDGFWLGYLR